MYRNQFGPTKRTGSFSIVSSNCKFTVSNQIGFGFESMMTMYTFPWTWHYLWSVFSRWSPSSSTIWPLSILQVTRSSLYSANSPSSLSNGGSSLNSSSSVSQSQCYLMIIVRLLGHSLEVLPLPWHLKHLISQFFVELDSAWTFF